MCHTALFGGTLQLVSARKLRSLNSEYKWLPQLEVFYVCGAPAIYILA